MSPMSKKDAVVTITEPKASDGGQVHVTEREIRSKRPHLNRRMTTDGFGKQMEEEQLTPVGKFFAGLMENEMTRYAIYILPVAIILAIPLVLYSTVWSKKTLDGHIPTFGLCIWLELVWAFLWISKMLATAVPFFFQATTGLLTTGLRKYALVLKATRNPLSFFIWTILIMASYNVIYVGNRKYHADNEGRIKYMSTFHKVLKVSVGMSALWLAEKLLVHLISVNYRARQHYDKIKDIKKTSRAVDLLYEASLRRYPDRHPEFLDEDYEIHDSDNVQKLLRQHAADVKTRRLVGELRWTADKVATAFGRIASDLTGAEVMKPTATHAIVEQALERKSGSEAMARRIYKALCPFGADAISEDDLIVEFGAGRELEARWIFAQLDRDGNGDVSQDEMIMLVGGIARQRKDMWRSACDIQDAVKVLDAVLSFIVFVIVCFFYAAFFSTWLSTKSNYTALWNLAIGAGFAVNQTVGEFIKCCIFVFIKHPYDIGDRVNIQTVEYEVVKMSLLYATFKRVDNGTVTTVATDTLAGLWIENVSRSKAMKERLTFSVSAGTSFDDIEALRIELQNFVCDPENSRHFHPEMDIQLLSMGDLKQLDLRVEIMHKSNWAIESLRAERRSRFMCALLSAMRKVPIDGPGGSGPASGSISNPGYSVAISDEDAKQARAQFDADKDAKRLNPKNAPPEREEGNAVSTGLEILKNIKRRSVETGAISRPSVSGQGGANPFDDHIRPSFESRRTNYPARPGHGFI